MATATAEVNVQTAAGLLESWQGQRRLTRRVIEAFPEDKLFHYSAGGMRPFAEMAIEFIRMAVPIVDGVRTGKWEEYKGEKPATKAELLRIWDAQTPKIDPAAPLHRDRQGVRPVGGIWAGDDPVCNRQRDSPPRPGIRLSARTRHRAPTLLGEELSAAEDCMKWAGLDCAPKRGAIKHVPHIRCHTSRGSG